MRRFTPLDWIWMVLFCAVCLAERGLAQTIAPVPAVLTIRSEKGDPIGQGKSYSLNEKTAEFQVERQFDGQIEVTVRDANYHRYWGFTFDGPLHGPLHTGTYAYRAKSDSQIVPEARLTINGGSYYTSAVAGSFTVQKIIYGKSGAIVAFSASFEQRTSDAPGLLRGEIKYNAASTEHSANQPPRAYAGPDQRIALSAPAPLRGFVADEYDATPRGYLATWTQAVGTGVVTFADAQARETTAEFSAAGTYVLRLTVTDGWLTASDDVKVTVIDPAVAATIRLESDARDPIGGGRTHEFSEVAGALTVQALGANGSGVTVGYNDSRHSWGFDFIAPSGSRLAEGTYANALRAWYSGSAPGLEARGNGRRPATLSGSFVVKQITFGEDGKVTSFWVTFEQRADGAEAALRGEIRYNTGFRGSPTNRAPGAFAGQFAEISSAANSLPLTGAATDDGVPGAPLTTGWTQLSGPAPALIANPESLRTVASFPAPGFYVLRLTVSDGEFETTSALPVAVVPPGAATSLEMIRTLDDDVTRPPQRWRYDEANSRIEVSEAGQAIVFRAHYEQDTWYVALTPPAGETLQVGSYRGATGDPAKFPERPALTVGSALHVSSYAFGDFEIVSLVRAPDGRIVSLSATFFYKSGEAGHRIGRVDYRAGLNAGGPNAAPGVSGGFLAHGVKSAPIALEGVVVDDRLAPAAVTCTWTKVSGPGGVTFANAGAAATTAQFSADGDYVLKLSASDGELTRESLLRVFVNGPDGATRVRIVGEPKAGIGEGATHQFDPLNSEISVRNSFGNRLSVSVHALKGSSYFDLQFAAPNGARLDAGEYSGATRASFKKPEETGLEVSGNHVGPGAVTGRFVVKDIAYGVTGDIERCWIIFEQHSEGREPATYGEVRYHVNAPEPDPAPLAVNAGPDRAITIGQTVTLTATATRNRAPADNFFPIWVNTSGPGQVLISQARGLSTDVKFSVPGRYVLLFAGSTYTDGARDSVTVTVKSDLGAQQVRGFYRGIVATESGEPLGTVDIQIGASGYYTANVNVRGWRTVFRGSVSENGQWLDPASGFAVVRNEDGSINFFMMYDGRLAGSTLRHAGTTRPGTVPPAALGVRAFIATPNAAAGGLGDAWGALHVRATGQALVFIRLPDKTLCSMPARLGPDGSLLLAYSSPKVISVIGGLLQIHPETGNTMMGTIAWHRERPSSDGFRDMKFNTQLTIDGSRVREIGVADEPFTFTRRAVPAVLEISGLSSATYKVPLLLTGRWGKGNGIGDTTASFESSIYSEFRGSFRDPLSGHSIKYEGVILQSRKYGRGFFFQDGKRGAVELRMGSE